ncbi:IkappaB kinase complex, IKAP component [Ceratobasidium sp. AG-I]|nr:IkappaB kinase complex, IKAP component [Ceratobasidium sp. AG-I]
MRNLALLSFAGFSVPEGRRTTTGIALDVDSGVTYAATEKALPDGGTDVEVWQLPVDEDGIPFATLTSEANAPFNVARQLVSFAFLAESRQLVLILAGGDIAVLAVDEVSSSSEIIGSVEPGIKAAAWGPDESQIVLVNGKDELLIMTKDFDVQFEGPLRPADLGEEKHSALGWGSKQTQFHGSLGKAAASSAPSTTGQGGIDKPSPDDDGIPRISWRGDGAFFVVSSLDPKEPGSANALRRLRFYSPNPAAHLSTSEVTPGLEGVLAWRPSGGLIASAQRFGYEGGGVGRQGRHDVVFFERCGLRRSDFAVRDAVPKTPAAEGLERPWGYKVKEMLWSTDSSILALWIERDSGDCVQLWTMGNYHWYLKQDILPTSESGRYTQVVWHPENALRLICATSHSIEDRTFVWDTCASSSQLDASPGSVAVVDGESTLMTPFKLQNVPPPMSSFKLTLHPTSPASPETRLPPPVDLAFSPSSTSIAFLFPNQRVQVWELGLRTGPKGKIAEPKMIYDRAIDRSTLSDKNINFTCPRQIVLSEDTILVLGSDLDAQQDVVQAISINPSPDTLPNAFYVPRLGRLIVANNVNSFSLTSEFLIFTTTAHEAKFVPISDLFSDAGEKNKALWGVRRVERGSRIVVVVPATASVVLQLPRGNLETINPRPLVLASVRADVEKGEFRKAFLACRKHRVDLHVLVEFASNIFKEDPARFVDQVPEVDYLNLFLTGLGQSKRAQDEVDTICDKLRLELEKRGFGQYIQSILTAHVVKTPPDMESALKVLHTLRESDPDTVEDAVKYIIFLVDADQLFNTALGMYDFALVLMIAQQSQKDPREYLPFLRELRALDTYYQRFRINDHLGRRELALENLCLAGKSRFEEGKRYTEKHKLYAESLELWRDQPTEYSALLVLYGNWLVEKREFNKAGQAFARAGDSKRAMFAFEKARMWKELFSLALDTEIASEDLVDMGYRVAESLASHSRYSEAARVYLDYAHHVPGAVTAFSSGNDLSEAFRVISMHKAPELIEEIVNPEAMDLCTQFRDDVQEMSEQLERQGQRLIDLKEKKLSDPSAYYGQDEPNLHNVDAMTDASGMMTQYTQYTRALTGTTAKRSQKSSKKAARKAGRKGTANEEEYILASLVKLTQRLEHVQQEASKLLPHLPRLSSDHYSTGKELVEDIDRFESQLHEIVEREWATEQVESDPSLPPIIPKPPKPSMPKDPWRTNLTEA